MPFYIYAWIASFSSALIVIITKLTSKHAISNAWLFNFLWTLVILLFTIPAALSHHAGLPSDWTPIIIAAFFAALWNIFFILSIYRLDVSTLSPLFNFRTVFAVLLGVLFLHENLTSYQIILFLVIVITGVFATFDEKFSIKSFFKSSTAIGLLAMLFLALNSGFIKLALVRNTIWTVNLWESIITFLLISLTIPLFYKDFKRIKINQVLPIGAMGIFQTVTNFTANIAYGVNVSVTSLIMAVPISMILAFLFSVFAPTLLEKHTYKVYTIRFAAAIIMIFAALQLSK